MRQNTLLLVSVSVEVDACLLILVQFVEKCLYKWGIVSVIITQLRDLDLIALMVERLVGTDIWHLR